MKSIEQLQTKDFTKWVRRQVRQFGRKAEIANIQYSAVEMWLKELGFEDVVFISGGEVEVDGEKFFSEWTATSYYMFNEDGMMETAAGRWLDICQLDNQEAYLIGGPRA